MRAESVPRVKAAHRGLLVTALYPVTAGPGSCKGLKRIQVQALGKVVTEASEIKRRPAIACRWAWLVTET